LQSVGVFISKRQVQRLLTDKQNDFVTEARDVLRAGLVSSPYVLVDDTGARHAGKNGFCPAFRSAWLTRRFDALGVCQRNARDANETLGCTQIGNDWFTWFGTRSSKSRRNFLDLLRAGHTGYVLNDAVSDYMRKHSLPAALIPLARVFARPPDGRTADLLRGRGRVAGASQAARLHRTDCDAQSDAGRHRGRFMGQRPVAQVPLRRGRAE
jgi:hypothetical protein